MDKKILKSLRLDPDVVKMIDELSKKHEYYTFSSIVNNLLSVTLKCATGGALWKMLSEFYAYEKGYVVKIEKDAEVLKERNKPNYDD